MVKPMRVERIVPGADYADDAQPGRVAYAEQQAVGLVRGGNFVPARVEAAQPAAIDAPAWLTERQPLTVDAVWTPVEGAQERTSAMDRAKALRVRLVPFVGLWGLLALIVGGVVLYVAQSAPGAALVGLLTFTALTAGTYIKLNTTDYVFSREGTERHRLDTAADLTRQRMNHEHELRRMALETYLKTLEQHDHTGGRR